MGRVLMVFSVIMFSMGTMADRARAEAGLSLDGYRQVLAEHVNDEGEVDYRALKDDSGRLESFITQLALLQETEYRNWNEDDQIAFWINTYNALTLKSVIDNYPIRASRLRALRYPENSIRQIPGVWTRSTFLVMGRELTLDEIEHEILRKDFSAPGIHMALVCAAVSCPDLRREPYEGERLDEQLRDQTVRFLSSSKHFLIDREKEQVFISSIFKWFGDDFRESYTPADSFSGYRSSERAVLNFISQYLDDGSSTWLRDGSYQVKYLDYDWNLNEQKRR